MKNKKQNKSVFFALVAVVAVVIVILTMCTGSSADYKKAYEKTNKLASYEMGVSTIITVSDGEEKQIAIDQNIKVQNKNALDMIYEIKTVSTSTSVTNGNVVTEESSYIYNNEKYYYTLPGIKYSNITTRELAESNIDNSSNIISFADEIVKRGSSEKTDEGVVYYYTVDYRDASAYVKAVQEQAIGIVGEGVFTTTEATGSALVKDGYVTERALYIECENEFGDSIILEFATSLIDTEASVEKPDDSKYPEI